MFGRSLSINILKIKKGSSFLKSMSLTFSLNLTKIALLKVIVKSLTRLFLIVGINKTKPPPLNEEKEKVFIVVVVSVLVVELQLKLTLIRGLERRKE
ncbi:hypothetical protein BpHYR1_040488 [Brachionus plicatilis]|uniref:Uncharacterized protein n=1 Tax=Brachionus plicatilis TaxID=10195 RepID=A0A3M7SNJ6_BRAPC|nr:hypothetical protein BpHYR1_040488 [Brachionus plicatilis]